MALTPGQRHEAIMFESLMETGAINQVDGFRAKLRSKRVTGDEAYSSCWIRQYYRERKVRIHDAAQED